MYNYLGNVQNILDMYAGKYIPHTHQSVENENDPYSQYA